MEAAKAAEGDPEGSKGNGEVSELEAERAIGKRLNEALKEKNAECDKLSSTLETAESRLDALQSLYDSVCNELQEARDYITALEDDAEKSDASKDSDADKASEAATTGEEDGNTAEAPADADDGSDLPDEQDETDEGWPSEGKGKDEADENKAVKPGDNK